MMYLSISVVDGNFKLPLQGVVSGTFNFSKNSYTPSGVKNKTVNVLQWIEVCRILD